MIKPVSIVNAYNHMKKYCLSETNTKIFPNGTKVNFGLYRNIKVVCKTAQRKNGTKVTTCWRYLLGKDGFISHLYKTNTCETNKNMDSILHYYRPFKAGRKVIVNYRECKPGEFEGETLAKNLAKDADLSSMSSKERAQIEEIKEKIKLIRNA